MLTINTMTVKVEKTSNTTQSKSKVASLPMVVTSSICSKGPLPSLCYHISTRKLHLFSHPHTSEENYIRNAQK